MGELGSEGGLEFANNDQQGTEWGGHPLFPRSENETGPDRRRFDIIHIQRYKNDGSREVCPKAWKGSDLRSWEQIVEAYGGGIYQLTAQCSRTFRYQAHSDKIHLSGPSKSFVEVARVENRSVVHESAPEPAPVAQAPHSIAAAQPASMPAPAPTMPPGFVQAPAYPYPYPPPPPPAVAPAGNAETLALIRAVLESSNAEKTTLMRALLERSGKETGSLEVVREILPMMQGGANGTQALLQGVELARGLIGPAGIAAPAPQPQAPAEDELALVGQVLRMIAPTAAPPAPVAAPSGPPAGAMAPPPAAAPPGWAWAYTAAGWVLVQLAQVQPYPMPMPPPAPAAPAAPGIDLDAALAAFMADPARLARLRAVLGAQGAPPAAAKPVEPAKPAAESNAPPAAEGLGAGLEAVLADPEVGKLFASLSALGGAT